jgi:hypothetical protein
MALTRDKIREQDSELDEVTIAQIITLIRQHDFYRLNATIFSSQLEGRINAASGTTKGKMLNALMFEIDDLNTGQVEIRGDSDAVWWSQHKERQALVKEMLDVLFDEAAEGMLILLENGDIVSGTSTTGIVPSAGNYGTAAIGQRPYFSYICGTCHRSYSTTTVCCGTAVRISSSTPLNIFFK